MPKPRDGASAQSPRVLQRVYLAGLCVLCSVGAVVLVGALAAGALFSSSALALAALVFFSKP